MLPYAGLHGIDGVCHVRVYEQPGRLPVVIAGALDDNPGTALVNAIEAVADAVSRTVIADGREFQLVEHPPPEETGSLDGCFTLVHLRRHLDASPGDEPASRVRCDRRVTTIRAGTLPGDCSPLEWEPLADVEAWLGCTVEVWPRVDYTARTVAGEAGERLRRQVAARAHVAAERLVQALECER